MVDARELVGRTRELETLRASCRAASDGPAGFVLEGPAGIGKTALWEAARDLASGAGLRVLACRAARTETDLAFTALGDLLQPVQEALGRLPAPQARALRVALLLEDPGDAPADPRALGLACLGVLEHVAPVALLVDDLQWLDAATTGALAFALRRLTTPVLVAATVRREGAGTPRPELLNALPADRLKVVDVGPLGPAELRDLLRDRLGRPVPRGLEGRIGELSGGNPLYALELLRAAVGDALPDRLPGSLRELVADRIDGLPVSAREALAVVAAVPEPPASLVRAVVDDPDGLRLAETAGAVVVGERVRFAHPLMAGAIEGVDPERRRALHRRIAAVVTDPLARASHLGLAAVAPDPAVAAELEEAARLAAARGAPLTAAQLLERALDLLPRTLATRRAAAAVAAARLHHTGGDERRGRVLLQQILDELPAGPGRVDALLGLAELEDHPIETTIALVRQALDEAGDDPGLRARVLIMLAEYHGVVLRFEAGAASAREAARLASAIGDRPLGADALSHAANLAAPLGRTDPVPLLERAAALAEHESGLDPWWRPRFSLERWRCYTDDLDAAAEALERRSAGAAARGDDHERQAACLHLTELECRRGRLDAARRYAGEGLDLTEQLGADLSRAAHLYGLALVAAHAGVRAEAERLAGDGMEICHRIGFRWMELQLQHVLGLAALAHNDHAAAAAHLVPLMADLEAHDLWDPGMIPAHPDAIEAAIGTGLLAEAAAWLATYEEVGRRLDRPRALACGARCRGLLDAAAGDLPAALGAVERALAEHERLPVPIERARTLLARGTIQRRSKQRGAARASLEEAASAFDAIGAAGWAERARAELARIGGRAPGGDGLTATEARVAELVAAGRSNREVATELFVSVRAVEANLSRVYAKLGVRGRTQLAARLARGDDPP